MIDSWFKYIGYLGAAVLFIGAMFFLGGNDPYYRQFLIIFICLLVLSAILAYIMRLSRSIPTDVELQETVDDATKHWAHAKAAIKAAGWNSHTPVLDIGFIAFWGKETAYTYRTQAIPTSANAVQPYIRLERRNSTPLAVEFIIENRDRQTVFKTSVTPDESQNFITPPARLPLRDLHPKGKWTLLVAVNGKLWAKHRFSWRIDEIEGVDGHIDSDGEVDAHILPLLVDNYAEPVSLDDLLNDDAQGKSRDYQ